MFKEVDYYNIDELYSDDGISSSDDAALDRKGIYEDWGYDGMGYLSDQLL